MILFIVFSLSYLGSPSLVPHPLHWVRLPEHGPNLRFTVDAGDWMCPLSHSTPIRTTTSCPPSTLWPLQHPPDLLNPTTFWLVSKDLGSKILYHKVFLHIWNYYSFIVSTNMSCVCKYSSLFLFDSRYLEDRLYTSKMKTDTCTFFQILIYLNLPFFNVSFYINFKSWCNFYYHDTTVV